MIKRPRNAQVLTAETKRRNKTALATVANAFTRASGFNTTVQSRILARSGVVRTYTIFILKFPRLLLNDAVSITPLLYRKSSQAARTTIKTLPRNAQRTHACRTTRSPSSNTVLPVAPNERMNQDPTMPATLHQKLHP